MTKSANTFQAICFIFFLSNLLVPVAGAGENLDKLIFTPGPDIESGLSVEHFSLQGYTNYWYEFYGTRYHYAGLYAETVKEPHNHIRQIHPFLKGRN